MARGKEGQMKDIRNQNRTSIAGPEYGAILPKTNEEAKKMAPHGHGDDPIQ